MTTNKLELVERGRALVEDFCRLNGLPAPAMPGPPPPALVRNDWQVCGLYHAGTIYVDPKKCAAPGYGGPAWSWPGYVIDRTPFGVYAHELGHYVDDLRSPSPYRPNLGWVGAMSTRVHEEANEPGITGYCPNRAEWFAEIFRLFATNPDLLKELRPRAHAALTAKPDGLIPLHWKTWREVLDGAPKRLFPAARKKIVEEAARKRRVAEDIVS